MGYDPPSVKTMAWYNDITYLNEDTIFVNVSSDFAIKGSTGSFAEAYAKKFSIPFVSVGNTEKTTLRSRLIKMRRMRSLRQSIRKRRLQINVRTENFRRRPERIIIFWGGIQHRRKAEKGLLQVQRSI